MTLDQQTESKAAELHTDENVTGSAQLALAPQQSQTAETEAEQPQAVTGDVDNGAVALDDTSADSTAGIVVPKIEAESVENTETEQTETEQAESVEPTAETEKPKAEATEHVENTETEHTEVAQTETELAEVESDKEEVAAIQLELEAVRKQSARPMAVSAEEIQAEDVDEEEAAKKKLFEDVQDDGAELSEEELELLAEEIDLRGGSSENRDEFDREILDRNFVNILIMSKNIVKRLYSRAKNTILSYKGIKTQYIGEAEYFRCGKDWMYRLSVKNDGLEIALALPSASVDKTTYLYQSVEQEEPKKGLEIVVLATDKRTMERAVELIRLVADQKELLRNEAGTMVAYADRYPVNRNGVLAGEESIAPVCGKYDREEYDDVTEGVIGEIIEDRKAAAKKEAKKAQKAKGDISESNTDEGETSAGDMLIDETSVDDIDIDEDDTDEDDAKPKSGAEQLEERRQTAKTVKAAIALQEPIVYYYDVAVDKEDAVAYVNIKQVLNDKFLGKLLPPQYFAVAEGSERIEDLNLLQVQQVAEDCNRYPDRWFVVPISCRLLQKDKTLQKLIKTIKTDAYNMVLAFDCSLLEAMGEVGQRAVAELRQNGAKVLLDNSENAGMRALTDYEYEIVRFDQRYYSANDKRQSAHLQMITGYAKALGIRTAATNVASIKDAVFLMTKGVDIIESYVVSEPKRVVHTALKERKKMPPIR